MAKIALYKEHIKRFLILNWKKHDKTIVIYLKKDYENSFRYAFPNSYDNK